MNQPRYGVSKAQFFEPVVILRPENLFIADTARIDSFVKLECGEGILIGEHVHIASFVHVLGGGSLAMGDGSSLASGVKVVTGSNVAGSGHGCSAVAPDAIFKRSFVRIGRNATMFVNSSVMPGVTIGEGAVILPGAVVTRDVPPGETWGGVPAKRVGKALVVGSVTSSAPDALERQLNASMRGNDDPFVAAQGELYGWDG